MSKKDAYYFPHFSNARSDSKILKLRRILGIEGYGIYFMLLEVLREQTEFKYPLSGIEDLAFEFHISREKVMSVINDFELFEVDQQEQFFSPKQILYLQPYIEKSERARKAAEKRWGQVKKGVNAKADANALQKQSDGNASKVKESKVNESKTKDSKPAKTSFAAPTISEKNQPFYKRAETLRQRLITLHEKRNDRTPKQLKNKPTENAVNEIRLMYQADDISDADIKKILSFIEQQQPSSGGFLWLNQIQSVKNFRKKAEKILLQAQQAGKTNGHSKYPPDIQDLIDRGTIGYTTVDHFKHDYESIRAFAANREYTWQHGVRDEDLPF